MAQLDLSLTAIAKSPWVVAGLLLLVIGIGDVIAGRSKLAQYHAVLAQPDGARPRDPARLFPKVTESQEQLAVARAKVGFYNQLFLSGQVLTAGGLLLVIVGLVRARRRPADTPLVAASR